MNYLQYIASAQQTPVTPLFLVSGADGMVSELISRNIIEAAYRQNKTLFIVDNTQKEYLPFIDRYRVIDALSGEVSLCENLLEVNSLKGISRLRALLGDLGFDSVKSMKVVQYLQFIRETENRLGNTASLTVEKLEEYGGVMLVKWKLKTLADSGRLSNENYEYLLARYSEVSAAAADFENLFVLLAPFLGTVFPKKGTAVHFPFGDFRQDQPMQEMMTKLLISYMKHHSADSATLIFDDGNGDRSFLISILKGFPETEVHMFSRDIFTLDEISMGVLYNRFPLRVYTRHDNMKSCEKVEALCGQVDVVKKSSTTTIDKRFHNNSAWDILLGTNRTETEIRNAPSREYRFRKEMVNALSSGTGIIDYFGNQVLFSF